MSDSAYGDGVSPDSVCTMMDDIYRCMTGKSTLIMLPSPLGRTGPTMFMEFMGDNDYIEDIVPKKGKYVGRDSVNSSVVSRARFGSTNMAIMSMMELVEADETIQEVTEAIKGMQINNSVESIGASSTSRSFVSDTRSEQSEMQDMDDEYDTPIVSSSTSNTVVPGPSTPRVHAKQPATLKTYTYSGPPASRYASLN